MTLSAHTIKSARGSRRKSKRLGRGNASGRGNFSTRGMKGQKSRSGGRSGLKLKGIKFMVQSTPKLRGFTSFKRKPAEVSLGSLERHYSDGDIVDLKSLKEKKIIGINEKDAKLLDRGELKKKLTIKDLKCTKGAEKKVKDLGGDVKNEVKEKVEKKKKKTSK